MRSRFECAISASKRCIWVFFADHRPGPEEEQNLFIDVDCRHPEAVLTPMPEGLSRQQVGRAGQGLLLTCLGADVLAGEPLLAAPPGRRPLPVWQWKGERSRGLCAGWGSGLGSCVRSLNILSVTYTLPERPRETTWVCAPVGSAPKPEAEVVASQLLTSSEYKWIS